MQPAATSPGKLSPHELADYLLEIGGTLVSYGCPSYRLEEVIRVVAEIEGYSAQAFARNPARQRVSSGEKVALSG
jgi:uncharacterized membrane protein YjjP (DUF1212 family)